MKLTRNEVVEIIEQLKPKRFTLPNYLTISKHIAEKVLFVVESEKIQEVIKRELFAYKRLGKHYSDNNIVIDTDDFVFEVFSPSNDNVEEQDRNSQPSAKCYKPSHDISRRQILRRTEDVWNEVKLLAEKEGITVSQILGLLLTRCTEKDVVEIGTSLWENNVKASNISIDKAIAIYTGSKLGRDTYTNQKKLLDFDGLE